MFCYHKLIDCLFHFGIINIINEFFFLIFCSRFLTLLPPINLNFNLGYTSDVYSAPSPVSAFMSFISQPLVVRLSFVIALIIIIISYAVYLVRSSWYRHQRYLQSVKLKKYDKLTCLKGHAQVGVVYLIQVLMCIDIFLLYYRTLT